MQAACMVKRDSSTQRNNPERSAATRAALVKAMRELFSSQDTRGRRAEEVVARAGVTRGALQHDFRDKGSLFREVDEQVEQEVVGHRLA